MISFLQSLPIGNAVRVVLAPPAGAVAWRVLRKTADVWTDQDDPTAGDVYSGDEPYFIDITALTNGTPYYYKPFYQAADESWSTAPSQTATPAMTSNLLGIDPLELVRERVEAALKADVAADILQHVDGYIPCLTAPPAYENTNFPIVTFHLQVADRAISAVGEELAADVYDPATDTWIEVEGWICNVRINIVVWVVANADTRIALRKRIAHALLGNLPVFNDQGMSQVSFSQADTEDMETYAAPVFQTITSLDCLAPLAVDAVSGTIHSVSVALTPIP